MVAGLGNPGPAYERTRHNVGFMVVDALAADWGVSEWQKKGEARFALDRGRRVLLLKPQSYMNLSGGPVLSLATFYKIPPRRILAVVDDLDLPFGTLRMRARGSSGGHNGLKSLIDVLGQEFPRMRIGIGRGSDADAIDRVLSPFSTAEQQELNALITRAMSGIVIWLGEGIGPAMNRVNAKV
ncbi:MAG: aminoacyl-tRNA hydrolase [Candidatus Eremiobacteraeota bacterium]|nr:aminoacyl-tRNA hydrolase [Candidatus Eremiobacteraeota bacterium]